MATFINGSCRSRSRWIASLCPHAIADLVLMTRFSVCAFCISAFKSGLGLHTESIRKVRALLKITVRHQRGYICPHLCPSD
jgi:hypothetical protein